MAPQPVLQDRAPTGAVLLRRDKIRPHRERPVLCPRGNSHVLYLASGPGGDLRSRRLRAPLRVSWNMVLRLHGACPDPLRPAPCVLYPVLADRSGRNHGDRRKNRGRCPEHLLRGACGPRKYEIFRGGHKVYGRKVPAYDFRTSGGGPGHVPGGAAGKEKGGIGTSPLRSTDLHAHGDHRAAGVYIPLYRAASLRDSLRVRRTGVHADAHARRWSRNDILRWAHRSVSVWNPSRKQKDRVALDRCGRSLLFSHVLCGVPGSDPET